MNILEKVMGPGLAAPETRNMRMLRWAVIVLASVLCVGVLLINFIVVVIGTIETGAVFAVLVLATGGVGAVYFIGKSRRDDEWLDERCRRDGDA